jgi:NAD(P)-dependent dehydrogenase (short-subunit alcohol dehydrogenase family)
VTTGRRPNVLLTGAAGHLGRRIALRLVPGAGRLVLSDVDAEQLADAAAWVAGHGGVARDRSKPGRAPVARSAGEHGPGAAPVITVAADVTDEAAARALVAEASERLGGLDVLVNAHGIEGPTAPVETLDPDDVRRTFDVNVMSLFWLCGAAAGVFKTAGGGRIVNMASGAGLAGGAFTGVYHASKHAVVGLTRSLARELAPAGILVNAVCPGFVASPMVDRIVSSLGDLDLPTDYRGAVPLGRYADPDEVAETVRYLATDAPGYMTGACLVLDGGLRA